VLQIQITLVERGGRLRKPNEPRPVTGLVGEEREREISGSKHSSSLALFVGWPPLLTKLSIPSAPFRSVQSGLLVTGCGHFLLSLSLCRRGEEAEADSGREAQRIEDPSMRFGGIHALALAWPLASSAPCLPLSFSTVSGRTDGGRLAGIAWADPPMAERAGAPTHKHTRAGYHHLHKTLLFAARTSATHPAAPSFYFDSTLPLLQPPVVLCCVVSHCNNPPG
jgi:hypothetical protein